MSDIDHVISLMRAASISPNAAPSRAAPRPGIIQRLPARRLAVSRLSLTLRIEPRFYSL